MLLLLDKDTYNSKFIILQDPVKNILRHGCEFLRVIYSNENISLNGLYIEFKIIKSSIVRQKNNTMRLKVNKSDNRGCYDDLFQIEKDILALVSPNITKTYALRTEITKIKMLKINDFSDNVGFYENLSCILRVFGVWKDNEKCGLNYQIICCSKKDK